MDVLLGKNYIHQPADIEPMEKRMRWPKLGITCYYANSLVEKFYI